MPENGFIINKSLSKILALELSKVSRGEAFDSLTKLLDNLQKKSNLIKLGIDNGTDLIKEHCMNLRNDVQLKTEECIEEVILQVNDISTKIIDEINEYEQELIESNKKKSKSLEAFNSIVKELESFHTLNTEYLNKNEVDDKLVKKSNEEATNLIIKAELEIENLKCNIFDGHILKFKRNNEKLNKNILGITIGEKIIESFILSEKNQIKISF